MEAFAAYMGIKLLYKSNQSSNISKHNPNAPRSNMSLSLVKTNFLIMSDTHDLDLREMADVLSRNKSPPKIDVVLHCGDLTENGGLESHEKAVRGLGAIDAELRLVIAGNHDVSLDCEFYRQQTGNIHEYEEALKLWRGPLAKENGVTYLEEGTHEFVLRSGAKLVIHATPYQPKYGVSAFQYPTGEDRFNPSEETVSWAKNVATKSSIIPAYPKVDIVMSHGPPKYLLDKCDDGSNGGCEHLRRAICRAKPRLHCFGHIHPSWGARKVVWRAEAHRSKDNILEGLEDNQEDDMVLLPAEFVGRNSSMKKGFASLGGSSKAGLVHGKQTLLVNAAVENDEGRPGNVPWLMELDLPIC